MTVRSPCSVYPAVQARKFQMNFVAVFCRCLTGAACYAIYNDTVARNDLYIFMVVAFLSFVTPALPFRQDGFIFCTEGNIYANLFFTMLHDEGSHYTYSEPKLNKYVHV